ncbi:Tyrosine recombinase XerC [Oligella urethralis]|uniref:site-specific integrase n=1 Tax=Oligella urethralis TaxID=90245 RepID=UPI00295873C9|nr:site-specific integrase [Oligella urethralis]WOS36991.1 Tyrosine recombinase XerC [Oligella urethralis]
MRNAVIFALSTGARANEILSLEWSQVDLNEKVAWLTADKTKSGKARPIPLNDDTCAVLKSCQGDDPRWVFVRDSTGQNPKTINYKSFNAATKAVGLDDFHFHDLRHTWASWHVQAGTPLFVLKEMGGWETLEMVKKYAHLNASHLAEYSSVLTFWSPLDDLKPPTKEKAA